MQGVSPKQPDLFFMSGCDFKVCFKVLTPLPLLHKISFKIGPVLLIAGKQNHAEMSLLYGVHLSLRSMQSCLEGFSSTICRYSSKFGGEFAQESVTSFL